MQLLTVEQFADCVNQAFVASLQDCTVEFTLVEARALAPRGNAQGLARAPFSLLFLSRAAILFPQQIYAMRHPRLGEIGIFLVPIAQNRDGYVYEAVFN